MASHTSEKEIKNLEKKLEEQPDSLLFARLADAYRKEGNINQAIELCLNGLTRYPRYTTGRILLGRCYLEQQKVNEAIEAFTTVCTTDRCNHVAIKMLADIFAQQGIQNKAGDLYALLTLLDPDNTTIERLSAQFRTTGTTDLFLILGITAMRQSDRPIPSASPKPKQQQPETFASLDESESSLPTGDDFGALFSSVEDAVPENSGAVSGADISDRMSSIFGETVAPVKASFVKQTSFSEENQSDIESVIADITSGTGDISGEDVSDRIEELFTDSTFSLGGKTTPPIPSDSFAFEDSISEHPESATSSLVDQDFDFSGIGEEQQQNFQTENNSSFLNDDANALSELPTLEEQFSTPEQRSLDTTDDAPAPDFDIDYLNLSESGTPDKEPLNSSDVVDRLEDLFAESESIDFKTDATSATAEEQHLAEGGFDVLAPFELMDNERSHDNEIPLVSTNTDDDPSFEEPTVIAGSKPASPEADFLELVPTGQDSDDELSGNDIAARLDGLFDNEEPLELQPNTTATVPQEGGLPDDAFTLQNEMALEQLDLPSVEENEITGVDIGDRIDEIMSSASSGSSLMSEELSADGIERSSDELPDHTPQDVSDYSLPSYESENGVLQEDRFLQNEQEVPEIIDTSDDLLNNMAIEEMEVHEETVHHTPSFDALSVPEEIVRKDGSETTFDQLLPSDSPVNELFSENLFEQTTVDAENEDVVDEDFTPPAFEETLQFDSALFEQMLNPEDDSSQQNNGAASEKEWPHSGETLHEDDFDIISTQSLIDENNTDRSMDNRFKDHSLRPPVSIDLVSDLSQEEEPDVEQDNNHDAPELILDSTATFEVAAPRTASTFQDLLEEAEEDIPESSEPEDRTFANRLVSDNTEVIDIAPSGDDVVGKIDAMFSEAPPEVKPEPGYTHSDGEVIDLTKEYLLDDIAELRDEQLDEEEDAALIETLQFSSMTTTSMDLDRGKNQDSSLLTTIGTTEDEPPELTRDTKDASPISGSDVVDRLDTYFSSSDLLSLSSEDTLLQDDEPDVVNAPVADFYTLAGDNATGSTDKSLPDAIDEVEFVAADSFADDQTVELTKEQVANALSEETFARKPATFSDEMLPQGDPFDDFPIETVQMDADELAPMMASAMDDRDKPFDIPDHVLTPTLADIYFQQGQYKLAQQVFLRLLSQDPENRRLQQRYNEIKAMFDQGVPPPPPATQSQPQTSAATPFKKNEKTSKITGGQNDVRPLAGVRIKKRTKTTRKGSGRKDT